jgi:hypothetical protein
MTHDRGICSHCGKELAVRSDGTIASHRWGNGTHCPGTRRPPSATTWQAGQPGTVPAWSKKIGETS